MPPEGAFGRHDSGLFPYIEEDVKKYGDGGWQGGNLSDRYREKGPQKGKLVLGKVEVEHKVEREADEHAGQGAQDDALAGEHAGHGARA